MWRDDHERRRRLTSVRRKKRKMRTRWCEIVRRGKRTRKRKEDRKGGQIRDSVT